MRVRGKAVSAATATNWMFKYVRYSIAARRARSRSPTQLCPRLVDSPRFPQHPVSRSSLLTHGPALTHACAQVQDRERSLLARRRLPLMLIVPSSQYFVYGTFCICAAINVFFMFPETKGRTLEEMDDLFAAGHAFSAWRLSSVPKKTLAEVEAEMYVPPPLLLSRARTCACSSRRPRA